MYTHTHVYTYSCKHTWELHHSDFWHWARDNEVCICLHFNAFQLASCHYDFPAVENALESTLPKLPMRSVISIELFVDNRHMYAVMYKRLRRGGGGGIWGFNPPPPPPHLIRYFFVCLSERLVMYNGYPYSVSGKLKIDHGMHATLPPPPPPLE